MKYILVILEKPSVAAHFAKALGISQKKDGYFEGKGYRVSWALGHLLRLADPKAYGYTSPSIRELPFKINSWKLEPVGEKKKQLNILCRLMQSGDCLKIINGTDAGREGELIFRYIYEYANCQKKTERLWVSSTTKSAILEGMQKLQPGEKYDNLACEARCRAKADWLMGLSGSFALTKLCGNVKPLSIGRVQTPVFTLIAERLNEVENFQAQPYFQPKLHIYVPTSKGGVDVEASPKDSKDFRFILEKEALLWKEEHKDHNAYCMAFEKKEAKEKPPFLFDLTSLQQTCNQLFGFSAKKTLEIAQKLYEHPQSLITYPRTDSPFITKDIFETIPELIAFTQNSLKQMISENKRGLLSQNFSPRTLPERNVNEKKITDHHAILPTGKGLETITLSSDEICVYRLILIRLLESFSGDCTKLQKKALLRLILSKEEASNVEENGKTHDSQKLFEAKTSEILTSGWRGVRSLYQELFAKTKKEVKDKKELERDGKSVLESKFLPDIQVSTVFSSEAINIIIDKKNPKAPVLFTDATLLDAMKNAGKALLKSKKIDLADSVEIKKALQKLGLGTPATRADMIEKLIKRGYIQREKGKMTLTSLGRNIYPHLKDLPIASASLTAKWENALAYIGMGSPKVKENQFMDQIYLFTSTVVKELAQRKALLERLFEIPDVACPQCQEKHLLDKGQLFFCVKCNFKLFKKQYGKTLNSKDLTLLLQGSPTSVITFKSKKNNKSYQGSLRLEKSPKTKQLEIKMQFEDRKGSKKKYSKAKTSSNPFGSN